MKRRICALALTLCLLLALSAEGGNAATVYFTAVNDTLLELNDATMPYWSGGLLYVPATAFSSGDLGISYSYNAAKKTLTLRRSGFRLICNLASGMTVDSDGTLYDLPAQEKGGVVFLPINDACRIFSLSCSKRSVQGGYLVRIRNESAAFTDEAFITAASTMLNSRYQDYLSSHRQEESSQEAEDTEGRSLYLALTVRSAAQLGEWLDVLDDTAHHAAFFLSEEFFRDADGGDALRRALSGGHALGLAAAGESARAIASGLYSGNEALEQLVRCRTRLALCEKETLPQDAAEAGYCQPAFDLSCAGESELTAADADRLLTGAGNGARLALGDSLSAASLRILLRAAESRGFTGMSLRETVC